MILAFIRVYIPNRILSFRFQGESYHPTQKPKLKPEKFVGWLSPDFVFSNLRSLQVWHHVCHDGFAISKVKDTKVKDRKSKIKSQRYASTYSNIIFHIQDLSSLDAPMKSSPWKFTASCPSNTESTDSRSSTEGAEDIDASHDDGFSIREFVLYFIWKCSEPMLKNPQWKFGSDDQWFSE